MRGWAILPAALLGAAALVARAPAQEAPAPAGPVHLGAGSCAAQACHGGAFVERQEYKTWATVDRHSRAFDDLTGDIGKRIGDRLGIDPEQAPECLACHGTTGVETAATFDPHDGVSCELCHGAAQAWLGPHAAPAWKKMSPGEKERLGLRDLTTPGKRAALCVGCHIGGPGRDITHAMMAAGHPPLEFDLAAFLQAMPPHWEEKTPASPATTWVEGIKAESAARLGQLSRAARLDYGWPEFAVFDCWSCHHLAYSGSVYERAPLPARPGDLAVGLAGLQTLVIAAGDDVLAKRFDRHVRLAWRPGTPPLELADFAASAAGDVQRILPDSAGYGRAEADRFVANLDAYLARADGGQIRLTRAQMQQITLALLALVPQPGAEGFRAAMDELDEALDVSKPYDAAACAAIARRAIAASK